MESKSLSSQLSDLAAKGQLNLAELPQNLQEQLHAMRWKCRTDSRFLGNILSMDTLIREDVHGPLLDSLQKFPIPSKKQFYENDRLEAGRWIYNPIYKNISSMPGKRRRLILYPRNSGKTTLNIELHTIQWIINYPYVCMAIFQYKLDKARAILDSIKKHFISNGMLRVLFPECCPPAEKLDRFGTQDDFTCPAREATFSRSYRESTVMVAALESGLAGYHFDVIKYSDLVDLPNVQTPEQIVKTIDFFRKAKFLLKGTEAEYWQDVEGTCWHFDDLYSELIRETETSIKAGKEPRWQIFVGGVWKRKFEEKQKFLPEERDEEKYPYLLDAEGKRISFWPEKYPYDELVYMEEHDTENFRAQYENNPVGGLGGVELFKDIDNRVIEGVLFKTTVNVAYDFIAVDSAQTDTARANFSAIVVGSVDRAGRVYIKNIIHGKFLPSDLINRIIAAVNAYRPLYLILEKSPFNEGLMPGMQREWDFNYMRPDFHIPEVRLIPLNTQKRKQEKLKDALQPAYARGDFRFVVDWIPAEAWEACKKEFHQFPKSLNDDIMDAIASFYEARTWFGREFDRGVQTQGMTSVEVEFMKMAGIMPTNWGESQYGQDILQKPQDLHAYYYRTGGL